MVANKAGNIAWAVLRGVLRNSLAYGLGRKRERAGRRVQYRYPAGGKTVFFTEFFLEQLMNRAHDITNHRLRCIIHAAALTLFRVISCQKRFIEMHNRVTTLTLAMKTVNNLFYIRGIKHGSNVIYSDLHLLGQIWPRGYEFEHIP